MNPSLVLEPANLAVSAVANSEDQIAVGLKNLTEIARRLRVKSNLRFYMLEDASNLLASEGLFPVASSISELLDRFALRHVYSAEDIRRSINDILSRAERLENLSRVDFFVPTKFTSVPDVLVGRAGALREGLELTLLHVGLTQKLGSFRSLLASLIAGNSLRQSVEIVADLDDIDPPGSSKDRMIIGLNASILAEPTVSSFVDNLSPDDLWLHAEDTEQIVQAIKLRARELRHASGCHDPEANCRRFRIGEQFHVSLNACQAASDGRHAGTTLETCARIVANMPKNEITRFFRPTGGRKNEDVTRASDGATAWRTHVGKDHEALRLMYWVLADESVELANVGPKNDLVIL
jgi:hypothetical protein